jgi:hypothetical protein
MFRIEHLRHTTHHLQQCHSIFFDEVNLSQFVLYYFQEYNIKKQQKKTLQQKLFYIQYWDKEELYWFWRVNVNKMNQKNSK